MDDLIKRSDAVKLLREKAEGYTVSMFATSGECWVAKTVATEAAVEIANMPTLDVVAVTRCKDCKHSAIDAYSNRRMCIRNGEIKPNGRIWFGTAVPDNHFCGYAEPPKEGE